MVSGTLEVNGPLNGDRRLSPAQLGREGESHRTSVTDGGGARATARRRSEAASPCAFQKLPLGAAAQSLSWSSTRVASLSACERLSSWLKRVWARGWAPWGQQEPVPAARRQAPEQRESGAHVMVLTVSPVSRAA